MTKNYLKLLLVAGISFATIAGDCGPECGEPVIDGCCQELPAPCYTPKRRCCPAPAPRSFAAPKPKCCPVPRQRQCIQRTICCPRPMRGCPKPLRCMPRNTPVCQPARPCDTGCNNGGCAPVNMNPVQSCQVAQPAVLQPIDMSPRLSAECPNTPAPVAAPVRASRRSFQRGPRVQPAMVQPAVAPTPVSYKHNAYAQRPYSQPAAQPMMDQPQPSNVQPMQYANRTAPITPMDSATFDFKE